MLNSPSNRFVLMLLPLLCFMSIPQFNHNVQCSLLTAQLVAIVEGELDAGNYSYYTMHEHGHYKLVLQSLRGDADLYVSDKNKRADFYNYDSQSTTYGLDEIEITAGMSRPIAISVYAHPFYSTSIYILSKYLITSNDKNYEIHNAESNENFRDFYANMMLRDDDTAYASSEHRQQQYRSHSYHQSSSQNKFFADNEEEIETASQNDDAEYENESILWTILIHLLKLIAEIVL
jgi:hypothetical protein